MRSRRLQLVLHQVGQNVAEARTSKNWSQFQLAEKAGIESRTVQRVEAGETGSLGTLIALADALRQPLAALFLRVPTPKPRKVGRPRKTKGAT